MMNGSYHIRRIKRGFTLIELIIVMVMLSVLAALSAPTLSNFVGGRESTEEARRVIALIRHARDVAIGEGKRVVVWFQNETNYYGMDISNPYASSEETAKRYEAARGVDFVFDQEQMNELGNVVIICWPDGSIDDESIDLIEIVSEKDDGYQVVWNETANRYELERGNSGNAQLNQ